MSVTAAAGFTAAGIAAGIKAHGALDLAVVAGPPGTTGAAVFTANRAAAAPVVVSRRAMASDPALRAVVVNSGSANAATGQQGLRVATRMAQVTADALGCRHSEIVVCSTGTIGSRLDETVVEAGCRSAVSALRPSGGGDAAAAILTTDTRPKTAQFRGNGYSVGGMAKGAGMVRPGMATMLAVITTDAVVAADGLGARLQPAVDATFNSLDVDGCESTNDAVVLMASGSSGAAPEPDELGEALRVVCGELAAQIAADAEGASRVVTIDLIGAASDTAARNLGRTIADSALVRASFYGGDPNWGRILGALGTSDETYDPDGVDIVWQGVKVTSHGEGVSFDEDALAAELARGDFAIEVCVGDGPGSATILTTDLTPDYAVFNGERS